MSDGVNFMATHTDCRLPNLASHSHVLAISHICKLNNYTRLSHSQPSVRARTSAGAMLVKDALLADLKAVWHWLQHLLKDSFVDEALELRFRRRAVGPLHFCVPLYLRLGA